MRTALEMTDFALNTIGYAEDPEGLDHVAKEMLAYWHHCREEAIRKGKNPEHGWPEDKLTYDWALQVIQRDTIKPLAKRKSDYVALFRPIEQALMFETGASGGNNDVLYTFLSFHVSSSNQKDRFYGSLRHEFEVMNEKFRYAVALTADRCIIAPQGRLTVIPYDDIAGVTAKIGESYLNLGVFIPSVETFLSMNTGHTYTIHHGGYSPLNWDGTYRAIMDLVTRYKREKYEARTGGTAPQQPPQPQEAPQPAPQQPQAVPQAAPQPVPQAAAPAGAGLPPETIETLKQLKGLLDADILTQEEFDAKKKLLLGL